MFPSLQQHRSNYRVLVILPLEYLEGGQRKEVKLKSFYLTKGFLKFLSQMFAKQGD